MPTFSCKLPIDFYQYDYIYSVDQAQHPEIDSKLPSTEELKQRGLRLIHTDRFANLELYLPESGFLLNFNWMDEIGAQTKFDFKKIDMQSYSLSASCTCTAYRSQSRCAHLFAASYGLNSFLRDLFNESDSVFLDDSDPDEFFEAEDEMVPIQNVPHFENSRLQLTPDVAYCRITKHFELYADEFLSFLLKKPGPQLTGLCLISVNQLFLDLDPVELGWNHQPNLRIQLHTDDFLQWTSSPQSGFRYLFADGKCLPWQAVRGNEKYFSGIPPFLQQTLCASQHHLRKTKSALQAVLREQDYRHGEDRGRFAFELSSLVNIQSLSEQGITAYIGFKEDHGRYPHFNLFQVQEVIVSESSNESKSKPFENLKMLLDRPNGGSSVRIKIGPKHTEFESIVLEDGFFVPATSTLILAETGEMKKLINSYQNQLIYRIDRSRSENPEMLKQFHNALVFQDDFDFNRWVLMTSPEGLSDKLTVQGEDIQKVPSASQSQKFFLNVNLQEKSAQFGHHYQLPNGKTLFLDSTSRFSRLAAALTLNAWSFLLDREGTAIASRGVNRNRDLKFLRHSGSLAYALLEILHFSRFGRVLDPQEKTPSKPQELIQMILNKLPRFVFSDLIEDSSKNLGLDRFVSEKVFKTIRSLLLEITESLKNRPRDVVLSAQVSETSDLPPTSQFFCFDFHSSEMTELFLSELMTLAQTRGYQLFKKSSDKAFQELVSFRPPGASLSPGLPLSSDISRLESVPLGYLENYLSLWLEIAGKLNFQIYLQGKPIQAIQDGELSFKLQFSQKKTFQKGSWFDLHPEVYFKGRKVDLDQETRKLDNQYILFFEDQYYLIDGRTLPRYQNVIRIWDRLFLNKKTTAASRGSLLTLPPSAQVELLTLVLNGVQVENNKEFEKVAQYLAFMETRKGLSKEVQKLKKLLPYQREGVQWLYDMKNLGLGAILADEMGLGKTAQAVSVLDLFLPLDKPALVVVPTSLIYNWHSEVKKFSNQLSSEIVTSRKSIENLKAQSKTVVIASYGMLTEHADLFLSREWSVVVFDEAHYLKNPSSERFKVATKISSDWRLALTGTPLENSLSDFFTLLTLVLQGSVHNRELESPDMLKLISKPFFLRRRKKDIGIQLPDKVEESVILPINEDFRKLYRTTASVLNNQVSTIIDREGANSSQLHMLAALTKLRQLCSDPRAFQDFKGTSLKSDFLVEKISECLSNGSSVLIFTQFLSTLDHIQQDLKKAQVNCLRIDGSTPLSKRKDIIERFQSSDSPEVLALTLKTGGVGLNLTRANVVFHLDPWWNPAVENQATDRAHRLGQTRKVMSYRLILKATLEEKIEQLKAEKLELFKSIFESESQASSAPSRLLSRDDFKYLIEAQE